MNTLEPASVHKFKNKMMTRDACVARYGHIDFASAHWPDAHKWIKTLVIPPDLAPHWHVLNTQHPVHAISCNVDMHAPLLAALNQVKAHGLAGQLHTFDGSFNIRMVRGSTSHFSAHSYGLAIDLNASTNPMSSVLHTTFSKDFVKCFTDQGFDWGGNFHHRKDPMHFSYCFE